MIKKCRPQTWKSKKIWIITAIPLFAAAVAAIITIMAFLKEDKTAYREFQAIKGNLARGVTESGSVDVGTALVEIGRASCRERV